MLCRTNDDDRGFILNPYYREVDCTKMNQRRRFYFKHGILKVEKEPISKYHVIFTLCYKNKYLTSWTDLDDRIVVRDLIAAVCRTLDVVLGVNYD